MSRLVQTLQSRGLSDLAERIIRQGMSPETESEFKEITASLGLTRRAGVSSESDPSETGTARNEVVGQDAAPTTMQELTQAYLSAAVATGFPYGVGPQWRSVGPWSITNGQTYGTSRVNVSGRVSALAVDPARPAHVLAGAANGGVWESFDRGASWSPRTDFEATLTVGALAFDPNNTSIVYCGTGEGNWWSWLGAGILRSSNGGESWSTLCTQPFVGQGFFSIVVDPRDGKKLYAGSTAGLYVSSDAGATWVQRRAQRTWAVSIVPGGTEVLASCKDGLFRSPDSGTTWSPVPLSGAPASFSRLAVAIAPSDTSVAYAWGADTSTTPVAYLWRREASAWTSIGVPPGVKTSQSFYDWYVAAAPDRNDQVYCGAIDIHQGTRSGGVWTWANLTTRVGVGTSSIHPDQHSIAFEPKQPNTIYAGNDGGVYRSTDRGISWQSCNNGLQISEFEYIAANFGSSQWLIGGTQDNGTNRWTGPLIWEHVADGDGGDCGVNRAKPTTVFSSWQRGNLRRSTTGGGFDSWTIITPSRPSGELILFYPPFECSATNGDTIALGAAALYVSRDLGATWTRLPFPSTTDIRASAMFIPNADTVLVGLEDGRIYRTSFTGGAWGGLTALKSPRTAHISDLHAEGTGSGRVWATSTSIGGGRVFRSEDGGGTWVDCSAGLPALPITAIEVDPWDRDRVWVSADIGVYQSYDAGTSWTGFSNFLPNSYVGDLAFHPHARVLRAGTRNRGVWEIPVDDWMSNPICGVQFTGSLDPNGKGQWWTWGWPATWHVIWTVMSTTVKGGAPQIGWTVDVERAESELATYWITVNNRTAEKVGFEVRYAILSRY